MTTVVINEMVVMDQVFSYFTDSSSLIPENLSDHIILGRWYFQDKWLQSLGTNSNLNIHTRKLSSQEILKITNESNCNPDFDINWTDMVWNITGDINIGSIKTEELCSKNEKHWFSLEKQINWYDCKAKCYKFLQSHMPSLPNQEKSEEVTKVSIEFKWCQFLSSSGPIPVRTQSQDGPGLRPRS